MRFAWEWCAFYLKMRTTPTQNDGRPIWDFCCRAPGWRFRVGGPQKMGFFGTSQNDLILHRAQTSDPCGGFGPSPPTRPCASFPPGLPGGDFAWEVFAKWVSSALRNVNSFFRKAQTSDPCRGFGPSPPTRPCGSFRPGLPVATPVEDSALPIQCDSARASDAPTTATTRPKMRPRHRQGDPSRPPLRRPRL